MKFHDDDDDDDDDLMLYRYSAFSSYLALTHSITAHQDKAMLYVCDYDEDECLYQCLAEVPLTVYLLLHSIKAFICLQSGHLSGKSVT